MDNNMQSKELMSLSEAQQMLGVSRMTIYSLVRRGELEIVREDPLDRRRKLVRQSAVRRLLELSGRAA
jgi:excisionase family DNA binding protein